MVDSLSPIWWLRILLSQFISFTTTCWTSWLINGTWAVMNSLSPACSPLNPCFLTSSDPSCWIHWLNGAQWAGCGLIDSLHQTCWLQFLACFVHIFHPFDSSLTSRIFPMQILPCFRKSATVESLTMTPWR